MPNDRFETARKNSQKRLYEAARSVEAEAETIKTRMASRAEESLEEAVSVTHEALSELREQAASAATEIDKNLSKSMALLTNLQEVHRVSTETALGGSHDDTALAESKAAQLWHQRSILYRWCTALAAIGSGVFNALVPADGWEWALRSPFGAGVAVFAWMSKYASDQGDDHRTAALIFKHQSLAFLSLGRFAQNMADEDVVGTYQPNETTPAQQFLSDVSKPLFTEQIEALVERSRAKRERSGWRRRDGETRG